MRRITTAALIGLLAGSVSAGAVPRLGRTRAALAELEQVCARARQHGVGTLYDQVPLLVGTRVFAGLERIDVRELDAVLDHVYESCLHAKVAVLEAAGRRRVRLAVPPAVSLADVRLDGGACRKGDARVLPVAVLGAPPASVSPFFARGELVRRVPALAGTTPEMAEAGEVFKVFQSTPSARRVGWDRPAGGLVREGSADKPPILVAIDHPAVREAIARDTAKLLADPARAGRPLYWSMGHDAFYTDCSAESAKRFVAWLGALHGRPRVVNAVWETDYQAFGPEMMPTPAQAGASRARWRDWIAFNQQRLTGHVRWARANVRAARPEAPIGLTSTRYLFAGSLGLSGVDPVSLSRTLDVVEIAGADPMTADLAAALAEGRRPVIDPAANAAAFGVLPHLLRGSAAVGLPSWPREPLASLRAIRSAERVLREALDARRLSAEIAALAGAPRPVALLYSEASMRLAPPWAQRCADTPYTRCLRAAYGGARFLDLGCGFVTSDGVRAGRLRGARLVIVAGAPWEHDDVVRRLVDHVETGGHLVVIGEALVGDEYGREADYLLRLGVEVRATARPKYSTKPRPDRGGALDEIVVAGEPRTEVKPSSAETPVLPGLVRSLGPRQAIQVNVHHEVLATFADGAPAIVTYPRGKGRVTYLAASLPPQALAAVFGRAASDAGLRPEVRLARGTGVDVWGVECRSVRLDGRLVAYGWNTAASAKWLGFRAAAVASAVSLSTGEPLTVRKDGDEFLVGLVRVEPQETVLVELRPGR